MSDLPVIPIDTKSSQRRINRRLTQREERDGLREWRQEISNRLVAMEEILKSEAPNFQALEFRTSAVEERVSIAEEALLDLADLVSATPAVTEDTRKKPSALPKSGALGPTPAPGPAPAPGPEPAPGPGPGPGPGPVPQQHHHQALAFNPQRFPPLNCGPPARVPAGLVAAPARNPRKTRAHQLW